MIKLSFLDAYFLVPLLLLCVATAAHVYKKSLSTYVMTLAFAVSGYFYAKEPLVAFVIICFALFVLMLRAIFNNKIDYWIHRREDVKDGRIY